MSKLDELIARWDGETGERIWDTESFADECIAELRRLQVRERRMEELERSWADRWSVYSSRRAKYAYDVTSRERQAELEQCQAELRAILEET